MAPVIGGVILSQWIAFHLTQLSGKEVLGVYAEKSEQAPGFELKRGYGKLVAGKNVLVVEDILNTGGSIKKWLKCCNP
ncbi:MAG: phosphoribosyltransferase family protein [Bdellovibrionota bacterium]